MHTIQPSHVCIELYPSVIASRFQIESNLYTNDKLRNSHF